MPPAASQTLAPPLPLSPPLISTADWPDHLLHRSAAANAVRVYLVGGAVRDRLLGPPFDASSERDWVVVGATVDLMLRAGFKLVGQDFPVFVHPHTHEEYALARTERKTARGYHGFTVHAAPGVTLEQDLSRRDLSINAMALSADGHVIDPCGGLADLRNRVLRHASPAFVEDPVRLLRLARFSARLVDFELDSDTLALLRHMVQNGEVDALTRERVWQELARGLMESQPQRMWQLLEQSGALARLLPELQQFGAPGLTQNGAGALPERWAHICWPLPLAAVQALHGRLTLPKACSELAELACRERPGLDAMLGDAAACSPENILTLLEQCDALRRPERFGALLRVFQERHESSQDWADPVQLAQRLGAALTAVRSVDTADIAAQAQSAGLRGTALAAAIRAARLTALGLT